jgi:hypothetical protein
VVLFEVHADWLGNRQPFPTSADDCNTALPDASTNLASNKSNQINMGQAVALDCRA